MNEKIYLDMLTKDSVSIRKQQFIIVEDVEYPVGNPWRRAYANSIQGREEVMSEIAEPYKSVILLMWGDTPTVTAANIYG